jgi:hypothetical protein
MDDLQHVNLGSGLSSIVLQRHMCTLLHFMICHSKRAADQHVNIGSSGNISSTRENDTCGYYHLL